MSIQNALLRRVWFDDVAEQIRLRFHALQMRKSKPAVIIPVSYTHLTGCFAMAAVGAFYLLSQRHADFGKLFLRVAIIVGVIAAMAQLSPTGDIQGRIIAVHQPPTLAGMEGLFQSGPGAPLAILGQPDMEKRRLDNPLIVPKALSFLTYRVWTARCV